MIAEKIRWHYNKLKDRLPHVQAEYKKQRDRMLNQAFISSSAYDDIMTKFHKTEESGNEAELKSPNFLYRHQNYLKILGCWRWKGLYENKGTIIPIVYGGHGIDFGGAAGPITKEAITVDFSDQDIFQRKVNYPGLESIDFKVDYIFTSHTLEHIPDLDPILTQMKKILKKDGTLIIHLPAYTCKRWRPENHSNKKYNDHVWNFHLSNDTEVDKLDLNRTLAADTKVAEYFNVTEAKYCGDNSILIFAQP